MSDKEEMKLDDVKLLLDNFQGYMIIIDNKGAILGLNNSLAKVLGKPREELIGKLAVKYLEITVVKKRLEIFKKMLRSKIPKQWEDYDHNRWWKNNVFPILDNKGNVTRVIGYIEDITEKKQNQIDDIRKRDDYYFHLISNINDIIVLVDNKGKIIYESQSVFKSLGYTSEERLNGTIFDHIHPSEMTYAHEKFNKIIQKDGREISEVFRLQHKNGSWKYFKVQANNFLNNENINAIVVTLNDITRQKINETKIKEVKDYLSNVIDNINEIIFTINKEKKITLWNKSAEQITGIKYSKLRKKDISELDFIINHKEFISFIKRTFTNKRITIDNILIRDYENSSRYLKPSISLIKDSSNEISDIIFICNDITFELDIHKQLKNGSSYLIFEEDLLLFFNLLSVLKAKNKQELIITREPHDYQNMDLNNSNVHIKKFSSSFNRRSQEIQSPEDLRNVINEFLSNYNDAIIYIERIDYLFNQYKKTEVLPVLYEINDSIRNSNALLFIHIKKYLLKEKEYMFLNDEYSLLPSNQLKEVYLTEDLFKILKFIYHENDLNKVVKQKDIMDHFKISKVTTQKKIKKLLDNQLLISKHVGRSNLFYITERGKKLISII